MGTAYALVDRVLDVKIEGRVTPEAIGMFREALIEALGTGGAFTVCFDRSSMTGTTREGRAALQQWAEEYLPQLAGRCLGWADVYDARRAASLANAAAVRGSAPAAADEDHPAPAYPQETFGDLAEARRWLRSLVEGRDRLPA